MAPTIFAYILSFILITEAVIAQQYGGLTHREMSPVNEVLKRQTECFRGQRLCAPGYCGGTCCTDAAGVFLYSCLGGYNCVDNKCCRSGRRGGCVNPLNSAATTPTNYAPTSTQTGSSFGPTPTSGAVRIGTSGVALFVALVCVFLIIP